MNLQEMIRSQYLDYLKLARVLPDEMRYHNVSELEIRVGKHNLTVLPTGDVRVDNLKQMSMISVYDVLYACFPADEVANGYSFKPKKLNNESFDHLRNLKSAVYLARVDFLEKYKKTKK